MRCPICNSSSVARIYSAERLLQETQDGGASPICQLVRVLRPTGPVRLLCQACGEGWWETPTPAGARQ